MGSTLGRLIEIDLLTRRYGEEVILANAGKCLTSQALGPKLEWVRRNEPDVWRAACGWYGCHSFVVAKLTGEYVLDHHTASQCDPLECRIRPGIDWATGICEPMPLPRLAWPGEIIGTVHPQPLRRQASPSALRRGRNHRRLRRAFSVEVRDPGDLMIMYGSTMFLIQVLADYHVHPSSVDHNQGR